MCDLKVDLAHSCRKWGICSAWLVPELARLRVMERDGLVRIRGSLVTVTELGRPFLRAICAVFDQYLPDQDSRPTPLSDDLRRLDAEVAPAMIGYCSSKGLHRDGLSGRAFQA